MTPLTQTVQQRLKSWIQPGDICIDATAGNGHDTLFLAEQVGPHGHVYAFDIQSAAIDNSRALLAERHRLERVSLLQQGHENLLSALPRGCQGKVRVVMFNLGYLPGADKRCITRAASTVPALKQAIKLLKPRGLVSIMLYPNHAGGDDEARAVYDWAEKVGGDFEKETLTTPGPQWLKLQKTL